MKPGEVITSTQNPQVKSLMALEKPRERRKQQLFVVGARKKSAWHWRRVIRSATCSIVFYFETYLKPLGIDNKFLVPVSKELFDKMAVRENSGGVNCRCRNEDPPVGRH